MAYVCRCTWPPNRAWKTMPARRGVRDDGRCSHHQRSAAHPAARHVAACGIGVRSFRRRLRCHGLDGEIKIGGAAVPTNLLSPLRSSLLPRKKKTAQSTVQFSFADEQCFGWTLSISSTITLGLQFQALVHTGVKTVRIE